MGKRGSREQIQGKSRQRRLGVFFLLCLGVLVAQLFSLQIRQYKVYVQYAENNSIQRERITAPRGIITDRKGEVLVDNVPKFDIVIRWRDEKQILASIRKVAAFLGLDSTKVLSRFDGWRRRNAGLAFPVVPDADKHAISIVRENNDLFPDLRVKVKARRRYIYGPMAAHLLGYVGEVTAKDTSRTREHKYVPGDMIGKMGLESVCEKYLRGRDGVRGILVNASGLPMGELSEYSYPPTPGREVRLTIDAELQAALENILSKWSAGAAVVLRVDDGSILAAASLPQFDPNEFAEGITQEAWNKLYHSKTKPLFNRILQAAYPPGSTLKIVSAFAALENEIVSPGEVTTYCTGAHKFGNRVFRCWKAGGHGYMNLMSAIVQSCDSYFFKLAEDLDVDDLAEAARRFGLGRRTGMDLPGETAGLVPDRSYYNRRFGKGKWTQGLVLNDIIGQGEYLASVLQMVRVAAAVANGGYLVTPHVIEKIEGEPAKRYSKKRIRGLNESRVRFLQEAMIAVVESPDGTAHSSMGRVSFAGKTGTSQNPHGEDHAWFISYAPAERPEIAMAVVIENAGHGASTAAPVAKKFYEVYFEPDSATALRASNSGARIGMRWRE